MTTIARQHPLKHQMRSIMIVSILSVLVVLVALFVQNYRALHGDSTIRPSQSHYSSIPGGVSPSPQAGRMPNNPLRGFRNVVNVR
jgi:hypothetical protein